MDTSSITEMAEVVETHWRSCCSSWTKFIRTPTCGTLVWKTVRKALKELGWEKVPNLWCFSFIENKSCSYRSMWMTSKRQEKQNLALMWKKLMKDVDIDEPTSEVEEIDETCLSRRTNFISWSRLLGMHSTGMQTERNHYWAIHRKCLNHECLLEQLKNYKGG